MEPGVEWGGGTPPAGAWTVSPGFGHQNGRFSGDSEMLTMNRVKEIAMKLIAIPSKSTI